MSIGSSTRYRLLTLAAFGNFGGAILTLLYFHEVDPLANSQAAGFDGVELAFFVVGFALLFSIGRVASGRWMRSVGMASMPASGVPSDAVRRRALMTPAFITVMTFSGWLAAGVLWGVLWPLVTGTFDGSTALRQMFGITFVGGTFVATTIFFGTERFWRRELPRFFPAGDLGAVRVPRLGVRARLLIVLLIVSLLPLAVLAVASITRANALLTADAATAAGIVRNLIEVVVVVASGGFVVSVGLATLLAASVAEPLRGVERAMVQVREGAFDARCDVVSNDEIGAVAEGFNDMVEGLRERERIRETFGKYVSPEVRDEILTGRAASDGSLHEVTILFADLRDFTPWVEAASPADVVSSLNGYFGEMDAAIRRHGGLVLQFIGDEIEAVFGAPADHPRHADAAVAAAREMGERLAAWNALRRVAGKPELRHGIGIHSGTVVAGNIGSGDRLSYALVGDAVNVASRVQSLNKELGTTVLVSAATCALLDSVEGLTPLPSIKVKGRRAEVSVSSLA